MTVTPVTTEASGMRTLTAVDRCERCGAQAYVATHHDSGELLWCAHHYVEHEAVLAPLVILDQREELV